MARYQNKPSVADLAARRGQTLGQLFADWSVNTYEDLLKRCQREGVTIPQDVTLSFVKQSGPEIPADDESVKVDIKIEVNMQAAEHVAKQSSSKVGKKSRKSKVTLDEPARSDEHDRLDPRAAPEPEDPA